jgi:hypothetical protein
LSVSSAGTCGRRASAEYGGERRSNTSGSWRKAGELPIQRPVEFKFLINLKTAKAYGPTIPGGLLAIADEVIEQDDRRLSRGAQAAMRSRLLPGSVL